MTSSWIGKEPTVLQKWSNYQGTQHIEKKTQTRNYTDVVPIGVASSVARKNNLRSRLKGLTE